MISLRHQKAREMMAYFRLALRALGRATRERDPPEGMNLLPMRERRKPMTSRIVTITATAALALLTLATSP